MKLIDSYKINISARTIKRITNKHEIKENNIRKKKTFLTFLSQKHIANILKWGKMRNKFIMV